MTADTLIGARVRFAPNPRWPDRLVEARVLRRRGGVRAIGARPIKSPGWLDTVDDAGIQRSVRPSRVTVIA